MGWSPAKQCIEMIISDSLQQAKLRLLQQPETYPDHPFRVQMIETRMSWVFLTQRYAYKLKKPVRYDYLDFSTVALRKFYCQEELRLNRRLAPEVYLAVIPITRANGALQLDGAGEPIDWLVKMRRLPREKMLDELLEQGKVTDNHWQNLATVLGRFYRACDPIAMDGKEYRDRYRKSILQNLEGLQAYPSQFPIEKGIVACEAQLAFLEKHSDWFDARAEQGKIVEGHGDLRPCHICFEASTPVIIDCLEFNRDFRILDWADDITFLIMECDYLGANQFAHKFQNKFQEAISDYPPNPLMYFYLAYRATLRARLALSRFQEVAQKQWPKWRERAQRYMALAANYCRQMQE